MICIHIYIPTVTILPPIVICCYKLLFFLLFPRLRPICPGGRSRHRNTATRCSSNRRQQIVTAAAVVVPTNYDVLLLQRQQSSWLCCHLFVRFGSLFSPAPTPKNLASAASSSTSIFVSGLGGCPMLTHIDCSVSARHHTTRTQVRSRRRLRVSAAAVVCGLNSILIGFV